MEGGAFWTCAELSCPENVEARQWRTYWTWVISRIQQQLSKGKVFGLKHLDVFCISDQRDWIERKDETNTSLQLIFIPLCSYRVKKRRVNTCENWIVKAKRGTSLESSWKKEHTMIQQITLQAIGPNTVMRTHLPCKSGLFSSGKSLWGFIVAMKNQCQCTCCVATPVPRGVLTSSFSEDILRSAQKIIALR